jgi:hypothetical protein
MSIAMHKEGTNQYRVDIRGTLRKAELTLCEKQLADELRRGGPVRLLFILTDFHGWEPRTDWNDLGFFVSHGARIERWRSEALMFAGADLRRAPVEFFPEGAAAEARTWLAG